MSGSLKTIIKKPGILIVPGATDAFVARIIESLGFRALYVTGAGIANTLGFPDIGLTTMNEVAERTRAVCNAVKIPVIADADTGYGNAINVARTTRVFMEAGVSAIQLEDQITPKKCGHFESKEVISTDEMVGKVRAATDVIGDNDMIVIARTDAREVHGLTEAIDRSNIYAESGADIVFLEAPKSIDELKRVAREVRAPLMVNMVEGGKTPLISAEELEIIGFKIVIYANTALRAAGSAVRDALRVLKDEGTTTSILNRLLSWDERQRLVRLSHYNELEKKYLGTS